MNLRIHLLLIQVLQMFMMIEFALLKSQDSIFGFICIFLLQHNMIEFCFSLLHEDEIIELGQIGTNMFLRIQSKC